MATELRTHKSDHEAADVAVAQATAPETEALAKVIELVRRDSRADAPRYLEETVAEYGGE